MNNTGNNQSGFNPEILHLMKTGQVPLPFLKEYMNELKKPDYPMDFVAFMDQMIKESGMDRKTIIARSGLSESLAYKYLNGNKKISDRDNVLAFCIAMRLNFPQTQHALRCCGMPLLGSHDMRAIIIRLGIEQGLDRYKIDECLENAGFPLIRISSDMPSAAITDSMYSEPSLLQPDDPDYSAYQPVQIPHSDEYEEIDSSAKATHCGNAPFDFNYFGSMTLKDKAGKTYHLEAVYLVTGETFFYVLDDEQYEVFKKVRAETEAIDFGGTEMPCPAHEEDMKIPEDCFSSLEEVSSEEPEEADSNSDLEYIEFYPSLLDATASVFFPYFMELDQLTDKKVADVMMDINDTRNYPFRIGCHISGDKKEIYIEMFNNTQPERREYFQIAFMLAELRYAGYRTAGDQCFSKAHFIRNQYPTLTKFI